jgi:hypothetical protein
VTIEERGRTAGRGTVVVFEASTDVVDGFDQLVDRRQSQRRNRTMAIAVAVVVAVFAVFAVQGTLSPDSTPEPMQPVPGKDVGDVPVWYDDAGLHRGDLVEQTPVELIEMDGDAINDGALALVRTGALYLDPATRDVWFHPWGGEPRIVGHSSSTGPSANPSGDIAAWFEGGELVVFDTASGGEIARRLPLWPTERAFGSNTCNTGCYEHQPPGNGFLEVSAERVVWTADELYGPSYAYDVSTGEISTVTAKRVDGHAVTIVDVHNDAVVYAVRDAWPLILDLPGSAPYEYRDVDPVDNLSRFSPSGSYVLSENARIGGRGHRQAPAIIDTQTGEVWAMPPAYSWIAWSYGDIALLNPSKGTSSGNVHRLLACDPVHQDCAELPVQGPVLMPTN